MQERKHKPDEKGNDGGKSSKRQADGLLDHMAHFRDLSKVGILVSILN